MELIFFAYTPPLDGKNTASEEHKGVIINYIKKLLLSKIWYDQSINDDCHSCSYLAVVFMVHH